MIGNAWDEELKEEYKKEYFTELMILIIQLFIKVLLIYYSTLQSISSKPFSLKNLFVFENGLLPKKPFLAEKGDG